MSRKFYPYFSQKLQQNSVYHGQGQLKTGFSVTQAMLTESYQSWQSEIRSDKESFREMFIRDILLPESTDHRKSFTWQFVEDFSVQDIEIITDETPEHIRQKQWNCFKLAVDYYGKVFGIDRHMVAGKHEFETLYDWFQDLLTRGGEKLLPGDLHKSEPLQYYFEIYTELRFGVVEEKIFNTLVFGQEVKPLTADDFLQQAKALIERTNIQASNNDDKFYQDQKNL